MKHKLGKDYKKNVFKDINTKRISEINDMQLAIKDAKSEKLYQKVYNTQTKKKDKKFEAFQKENRAFAMKISSLAQLEDVADKPLERYIFLLDDVLGDKAMKGYFSYLSYYCLKS